MVAENNNTSLFIISFMVRVSNQLAFRVRRAARRNLGRFNVRKDFWVHEDKIANRPTADLTADRRVSDNETIAGDISTQFPSSFYVGNIKNVHFIREKRPIASQIILA